MMGMENLLFLLNGLRQVTAADADAGVAIADLACRIGERFVARRSGEKKLPPVTGFCLTCHRREMEELDRKIAFEEEARRKRARKRRARR